MPDRHINISFSTGAVLKTLVILAAAWLLWVLRDVALIVLTAVVIASAVEPGVRVFLRQGVPRILSVLAVYLLLFGVLFILFYFFFPSVLEDFATFVASLPSYVDYLTRAGAFDTYSSILGLPPPTAVTSDQIMASVREALGVSAYSNAFSAASQVFGGVFSLILIVVFSFYFAVVETGIDDFLRIVTPRSHQAYVLGLWRRSQHKIGLWMQGQLILAVLIAVLVYLSLTILQVPHALFLAVIAGIFEIIPVFGPILAAIPAVAIAFVSGGPIFGALIAGVYILIQQFENHLIYPQVVTRVVGVPPLLVILALIIGAELAGFIGVILSVPIAATLQEFVSDFEAGRLPKRGA
jgi:predicted PurR-regulated permease PerM